MQYKDRLGMEYSANSENSIIQFDNFIDQYLASNKFAMPTLEALIESDAEMPMAHSLRCYMLKMAADSRFTTPINTCMDTLASLSGTMNTREQMHHSALKSWVANQYTDAVKKLEELLALFPRDVLALRLTHYLHFYEGDNKEMCASILRAKKAWEESDPYYGYLLGMESFGFEEYGNYEQAESAGRRAVDINKKDIWAAHAVAHVFQMQGRTGDGIPWVGGLLENWHQSNNFVFHLHWHKALFHLGAGELEEALTIYDQYLVDCIADDFYLDVCNGAALLWRLQMKGLPVGDRWEQLKDISTRRVMDNELVFSSLHYLMTPAILKDTTTTDAALEHFESWAKENTSQGNVCRLVGLPIAQSIVEIGKGEFQGATERLAAIKDNIYLIGGSHAQRHLFDDLYNHYSTG